MIIRIRANRSICMIKEFNLVKFPLTHDIMMKPLIKRLKQIT
jgi:hypothetical protein